MSALGSAADSLSAPAIGRINSAMGLDAGCRRHALLVRRELAVTRIAPMSSRKQNLPAMAGCAAARIPTLAVEFQAVRESIS
jgi:hypothetical protein